MKQYNMTIQEKTLANGLHMILVHKPGYYRSLCTLATDAGGFDLVHLMKENSCTTAQGVPIIWNIRCFVIMV